MAILIDGYNLLHAAGIIPRGVGPGTLQRARGALLNWLVTSLEPAQVAETTVVFDAANPPPGRPRQIEHQGLTVLFSTHYENADAMLEDLIRQAAVPKRLVVVSSDHRVQRAARRRRSIAVDSDEWYFDVRRRRSSPAVELPPPDAKPPTPLSGTEVQHWLDEFSDLIDDLDQLDLPVLPHPSASDVGRGGMPEIPADVAVDEAEKSAPPRDGANDAPDHDADLANPFPPGYGEDLLDPGANLDD